MSIIQDYINKAKALEKQSLPLFIIVMFVIVVIVGFLALMIIGGILMVVSPASMVSTSSTVPAPASSGTTQAVKTTIQNTATPTSAPLIISGTGDDVVSFNANGAGLRIFAMQHSGSGNFAVILKDGDGGYLSLLANDIGRYQGKKSNQLSTGKYYLDVTANGPWSIQISR